MDLKCLFDGTCCFKKRGVQEGAEKKVNDTPLVSVIMATYRRERELSCALESLARQTWKNQEIILVVDNADSGMECQSKENVEGFQRRYQISLKYVVNETNKGFGELEKPWYRKSIPGSILHFLMMMTNTEKRR